MTHGAQLVTPALLLSLALFVIGVVGVFLRRNVITVFMCVELMLNAVNLAFVALSRWGGTLDGQVVVLFVVMVAGAEAAVGVVIMMGGECKKDTLKVEALNLWKW